jgi:hypothetical protein
VPSPRATGSRSSDVERNGVRAALAMLESVGKNAQCQDFGFGRGFIRGSPIGKYTRQLRNLRKPAPVFFKFALKFELHGSTFLGIPLILRRRLLDAQRSN